jgi:hypothetical protein
MGLFGLNQRQWGHIIHGLGQGVGELSQTLQIKSAKAEAKAERERIAKLEAGQADSQIRRQQLKDESDLRERRRIADLDARKADSEIRRQQLKDEATERKEAAKERTVANEKQATVLDDPEKLALRYAQGRYQPKTPMEEQLLDGLIQKKGGTGKKPAKKPPDFDKVRSAYQTAKTKQPGIKFSDFLKQYESERTEFDKFYPESGAPTEQASGPGLDFGAAPGIPPGFGPMGGGAPAPQTGIGGIDYHNYLIDKSLMAAGQAGTGPAPGGASGGMPNQAGDGAVSDEVIDITPLVDPGYYADPERNADAQQALQLLLARKGGRQLSPEEQQFLEQYDDSLAVLGM